MTESLIRREKTRFFTYTIFVKIDHFRIKSRTKMKVTAFHQLYRKKKKEN